MIKLIPIKNKDRVDQFKMISILIQFVCIIILFLRIRINKFSKYKIILNLFIWILFLLFMPK